MSSVLVERGLSSSVVSLARRYVRSVRQVITAKGGRVYSI